MTFSLAAGRFAGLGKILGAERDCDKSDLFHSR
jgi:hypothetical protein